MDNKQYEVRRDYAEGEQEVLLSLSEGDRHKVEAAVAALAQDPWPKQFCARPLGDKAVKITVPVEDDEIAVLYDVDVYKSTIDLITIKRRGRFKKAGEWLAGLMTFEPKRKS
jgi:hypothetical protein